jgi:GAF domain-containing protein
MMNQQPGTSVRTYTKWRAGFIQTTLISACIFGLVALILAVLSSPIIIAALYLIAYITVVLITLLPASYNIKAGTLVFLLYGLAVIGFVETGIYGDARSFMLAAITMAALLFSWKTGWAMTALAAISYLFFGWAILNGQLQITSPNVTAGTLGSWASSSAGVLLAAVLVVTALYLMEAQFEKSEELSQSLLEELREERATLEERVQDRTLSLDKRTAQLRAVADVGKSITSFRNLSELLQQTTQLIYKNFGYYHAGIFLLDEHGEYAVLAAANSDGGKRMLERKHQLKAGDTSIVGYVAENSQARIALDVGQDAVYFDNPDLPDTRSEMALPLVAGGQIFGVLDVQSTEPQAFAEEDIAALQILAEQIAVAIQNANLFSETERALETARILSGEVSRSAWGKILRNQPRIGYISTPPATVQIYSDTLEPTLAKAFETGDLILGSDGLTISVAINVRGQSIGAIRLKKSEIAEAWTQDEINLAVALSDQLSGALESARLYRESQQRAARESLVSDISTRISAASHTEAILRETVHELGQAIGNVSVSFQLLDQADGQKQVEAENGSEKSDPARKAAG